MRNGEVSLRTLDLQDNELYYFDNETDVLRNLTQTRFLVPSHPKMDKNNIIHCNENEGTFIVNNLSKSFTVKDDYFTLNTDYHTQENMFQIALDESTAAGLVSLKDIPLKASLFSGTEILTTLEHEST